MGTSLGVRLPSTKASCFCLLAYLSACLPVSARAGENFIDSPMYKSPELPAAPRVVTVFPEKAIDLWLQALERPEADLNCKAADAIALAHRRGVRGRRRLPDDAAGPLDDLRPGSLVVGLQAGLPTVHHADVDDRAAPQPGRRRTSTAC